MPVNRQYVKATVAEPKRLEPFPQGLSEALRLGVKKGRIRREDAAVMRSLLHAPIRRKVGTPDLRNLLEVIRIWTIDQYHQTHSEGQDSTAPDFVWLPHADWLADRLPVLYQYLLPSLVEYPIPQ